MSHNQSPGPSVLPNSQMFQSACVAPPARQKNKSYTTGIAAGVEDEKYQAKFKELKRKVKEIETDNDKLQFKVLVAKKSIQRMKLERAVLYERLSAVPPSPDVHSHHALPPLHPGPGVPPQHTQQTSGSAQDNDKLQFKVLVAKKSIQRMKLERAVLYERLSAVPPSPDVHSHHALPPLHPGPGVPPQHTQQTSGSAQVHRDHSRNMDINDHTPPDYIHPSGNIRVIPGPDGRPVQVSDGPIGPGVAPSHAVSAVHMSRRDSTSGHDSRQLPPLSQLTPAQHLEHPRNHAHSQSHTPHLHLHSNGSDSRSRPHSSSSHSRSRQLSAQGPPQGYHQPGISHPQQYSPEAIPHGQGLHSPPLGHERERSRRHDTHDRSSHSGDPYPHGRQHMSHASSHSSIMSPTSARGSSTRVHNHQRVGPAANINIPEFEHERDIERERNWSHRHELDGDSETAREIAHFGAIRNSPPPHLRSRPEREYQDHPSYRVREEHMYLREPIGPGVYGRSSRSDTPGSGSGSASGNAGDAQPRPDTHSQYYDRERRPYTPRSVNQPQAPNEDVDFVHEDGRSRNRERDRIGGPYVPSEQHRPPLEPSKKRSRNDMDVDGEDDIVASPPGDSSGGGGESSSRYGGGHRSDDRSSKRLHQEGVSASAPGYSGHDEPEEGLSDD
ncbi:hypothetical protein PAXINDRAFT_96592 [Paxillus involutus ATCC 200175]|nr:hypothetical protein PAXINDRAFT_96592 [Paxillus involutus ATCC 200175]